MLTLHIATADVSGNYFCNCEAVFLGRDTAVTRVFAEENKPVLIDPFNRALGFLGAGGWEMVSVQHALGPRYDDDVEDKLHSLTGNILRDRVAYLKRRAVEGRAVDQPNSDG